MILVCVVVGITSLFGTNPAIYAANSTTVVTNKADWELGTISSLDTEANRDKLQLNADGAWGARTLAEPPDTLESGSAYESDGTNVYVARGYSFPWFYRYNTASNTWTKMADAPYPFGIGSDMVYISGDIYVVFGLYSQKFGKYNIATNTWTMLHNTEDVIGNGASLAYDGIDIYLLRGYSSRDFYRYTIAADTWHPISATPVGGTISDGGDLFFATKSGTPYLFATRGASTLSFYRYDISAGTWSDPLAADKLAGQTSVGDSNGFVYNGEIYVSRSGGNLTWDKYNVASDTWTTLTATPFPLSETSGGMVYVSSLSRAYVFRGTSTRTFWSFNLATAAWIGASDPIIAGTANTVGTGGSLLSDGSANLYMLRGGNVNGLFKYVTATDTWSALQGGYINPTTYNFNTDSYGVLAPDITTGNDLYYFQGGNTVFLKYNITGNTWALGSAVNLTAIGAGGGMAYLGAGAYSNYIYALRGSGTATLYRYAISTDTWDDAAVTDLPQTSQATVANTGARMIADPVNNRIYTLVGNGSNRFLYFNPAVGAGTWTEITAAPFPAYYGTSLTYYSGKIYATAGYYKKDVYEYNITGNSWRKLQNIELAAANNLGPYNGAALAVMGTTIYALRGGATSDFYTYTISANTYVHTGTYTSQILDYSYVDHWVSLTSTTANTGVGNSSVVIATRSSPDNSTWQAYRDLSGTDIQSDVARYLQVRVTVTSSDDYATSPTISDYTVTYVGDSTKPTNVSSITGYSQDVGGVQINSGSSYAYTAPYFDWPEPNIAGGASDAQSGIKGYWVYWGTTPASDPETDAARIFVTSSSFKVNTPMSAGTYHLYIKAVDNKDNASTASYDAFTYTYNGVSPPQTVTITNKADYDTGALSNISSSQSTGDLQLTTTAGTWDQESLPFPTAAIYYGGRFAYVATSGKLYTFAGGGVRTFYSYNTTTNAAWATEGALPGTVPVESYGAGVVEGPAGYLYGWTGNGTSNFLVYNIGTQIWDDAAAADTPVFGAGAACIYDGNTGIYCLAAGSDDAFYRYNTNNNTWDTLANANYGNGITSSGQVVNEGGTLAYDGNGTIYSTQGNNYHYFAKYSTASDTWTPLNPAPVAFYIGGTLNYDSTTNALYGLAGVNRGNFLKYNIVGDTWTTLNDAPIPQYYGASQRIVGRTIYTLRGNSTTTFWKYDIDRGIWKKPTQSVFGPQYNAGINFPVAAGANFVKGDGNYYYATRGNLDNQFLRYDRTTAEVVQMAPLPIGTTTGASMAYDSTHGTIYATSGNNSRNFYKYTISTNTWARVNTDTADLLPWVIGDGSTMVYDTVNQRVYISQGGATGFQYFNVNGSTGSYWTLRAVSTGAPGAGSSMVYKSGYIYMMRGVSTVSFYRYDVTGNTWVDTPIPADLAGVTVSTGGSLSLGDPNDDKIYLARGNLGAPPTGWYQYDISDNAWAAALNAAPAGWGAGGYMAGANAEQVHGFLGSGTNAISDGIYTYTQQTSTTSFVTSGTYTSASHDLGVSGVYKWANLTVNYVKPTNTTITIKTASSANGSSWSSMTEVSNAQQTAIGSTYTYQIASPVARYLKLEVTMTSVGLYTPTLNDYTINYYQDGVAPSNPNTNYFTGEDSVAHTPVTTQVYAKYPYPKFSWPAAGATGGASDNAGGSGVEGYYLYLGETDGQDPVSTSGIINNGGAVQFQTTNTITISSTLTSGHSYYLIVKTRDNAQNKSTASTVFRYDYDSTAPTFTGTVSVNPSIYTATDSFQFSWTAASDSASLLQKYQYRTAVDVDGNGDPVWTDNVPVTQADVTIPNAQHTQGKYHDGTNLFYVRAVDNAGNASDPLPTASYFYSGSAPTPPQHLAANPSTDVNNPSTNNAFTFTWDPPVTYVGDESQLKYYWSVNVTPTSSNVTETSVKVASGALAAQQGINTFYVVSKDGAGNISYGNVASIDFYINTSAPSTPTNFTVSDLSDRDAQEYGDAERWGVPTIMDAGNFAGYKIYRSTDGNTFSMIATTTGTAYVDEGLTGGQKYYYKVSAYTKTNIESDPTDVKYVIPTGKYTSAPTIVASSIDTTIYARRFKFEWITSRSKGDGSGTSFAKCGVSLDNLNYTSGDFAQVLTHTVLVEGLTPSTAYYCYLYSADIDGNTATYGPMNLTTSPPPQIQDLKVSDITLTKARINFTTSVPATGRLMWGKTSNFDQYKEFATPQTDFSYEIDNLTHTSTYFYGFRMLTADGDTFGQETINKFDTLPMPVVLDPTVEPVLNVDTPTLKVSYRTNVNTTTTVYYSTSGIAQKEASSTEPPLGITHDIIIAGMEPLKTYDLQLTGVDVYGNITEPKTITANTLSDTKPPEVLSFAVQADPQSDGKTIIQVKLQANEPSTAQIEAAQGISDSSFPIVGQESQVNVSHQLSISVEAGYPYSLRVKLKDVAGNVTYTDVKNISGGAKKPTALQLITDALTKNLGWVFSKWLKT